MVEQEKSKLGNNVPLRTVASIYNPDTLSKEQLISTFVVRLHKFKKIFAEIKSADRLVPAQPILVVGLRGMGKTTLLLRLAYEVENDPQLNSWLLPIVFNEEEYGVTKLFKLWETIAQYAEQKHPDFEGLFDQMDEAYELENDPIKYEKTAFAILETSLQKHDKKLLLFIDNFGDMFKRFNKQEQQRLKEVLTTNPDLRIIAGSSVAIESFFKYGDPIYELFKIERLEGLNQQETQALLLQLGENYSVNPVKEILEKEPQRVEALRRLTGGIPRTMVLLFEIFVDDKNGNAFTDLEQILDRVTPLYKHRMDELPQQQQEILNAIAHNWDAISTKEIAKRTRLESKKVAAQLKQLKQNNLVDIVPTDTKNHLYRLHDRFFNIWYLMRMARKGDKKKVLWLIRFLEQWCSEDQLGERTRHLMRSLRKGGYNPKGAVYFSTALYYAEKQDLENKYRLSKQMTRFFKGKKDGLSEQLKSSDMTLFGKAVDALKTKDLATAKKEVLSIKDKGAQEYLLLSAICQIQELEEEAQTYFDKACQLGIDHPYRVLGVIFCKYLNEYDLAEDNYKKAITGGDVKSLRYAGIMYADNLNKVEEAESHYQTAIKKGDSKSWGYLGDLYRDHNKDYKKAEECYWKAIKEGHVGNLLDLGWMYEEDLKQIEQAENCYKEAIEKGETKGWGYLADLYRERKQDYAKAEEFYKKAIEAGHVEQYLYLGWMYENKLNDFEKAETYYHQAIEKGELDGWEYLGGLYLEKLEDVASALKYYQELINIGELTAYNSIAWALFNCHLKPEKALEAIQNGEETLSQENYFLHTSACVYLWNDKIDKAKEIGKKIFYEKEYLEEDDDQLQLQLLFLAKEEYQFIYDYFTNEPGQQAKLTERFKPLWYALLSYMPEHKKEYLRMPPEIKETVDEIIAKVAQMRIDYKV